MARCAHGIVRRVPWQSLLAMVGLPKAFPHPGLFKMRTAVAYLRARPIRSSPRGAAAVRITMMSWTSSLRHAIQKPVVP